MLRELVPPQVGQSALVDERAAAETPMAMMGAKRFMVSMVGNGFPWKGGNANTFPVLPDYADVGVREAGTGSRGP
jgi:hypothetical protein